MEQKKYQDKAVTIKEKNSPIKQIFKYTDSEKEYLQYSIKKTKLCRLKASDRLNFYNDFTNWTLSLISIILIIL